LFSLLQSFPLVIFGGIEKKLPLASPPRRIYCVLDTARQNFAYGPKESTVLPSPLALPVAIQSFFVDGGPLSESIQRHSFNSKAGLLYSFRPGTESLPALNFSSVFLLSACPWNSFLRKTKKEQPLTWSRTPFFQFPILPRSFSRS